MCFHVPQKQILCLKVGFGNLKGIHSVVLSQNDCLVEFPQHAKVHQYDDFETLLSRNWIIKRVWDQHEKHSGVQLKEVVNKYGQKVVPFQDILMNFWIWFQMIFVQFKY